jgi:hypothetical protein
MQYRLDLRLVVQQTTPKNAPAVDAIDGSPIEVKVAPA